MTSRGPHPDRRRLLIGGAGSLAVLAGLGPLEAQDAVRFRAVRVDVQPLIARGGRGAAQLIAQVLPAKLTENFADVLAPSDARAPTLVARIDTILLSSYADAPRLGFGSFGNIDSLEGAGVVLAGRQILSTTPLRVTLPASYSGPYNRPNIDERRIVSLCESFASWLRREAVS